MPSQRRTSDALLLRPLMALFYLAISLQSAFITILAGKLYQPIPWLPEWLAAALPLSASLFSTSIFALIGGRLLQRFKPRTLLLAGATITMAAFLFIGLRMSFVALILGRLLSGVGMGLVLVSISSLANAPEDAAKRQTGVTCQNAGMIAGLNLGIVIGAQLAEAVGYANVYCIAAVLTALFGAFAFLCVPHERIERRAQESTPLSTPRFLLNRKVASFLLLVFLPYMVASYYLYYFFPLYANAQGMGEAMIGRFYLLAGLIVAGCGPALTRLMTRLCGVKGANVAANMAYAALLILFALFPSIELAIVLVVLLSIVDSFAYSSQSLYFSGMEATARYGTGRAMGVYNLAENVTATAAPFVFASALTLGNALGVAIIGGGCVALLPLFGLLSRSHKEADHVEKA